MTDPHTAWEIMMGSRNRIAGAVAVAAAAMGIAAVGVVPAAAASDDAGCRTGYDGRVHTPNPAFVRDVKGRFVTFDAPGAAVETAAVGIDARGRIVGGCVDAKSIVHGFVRDTTGRFTRFDVPRASTIVNSGFLTYPGSGALDINEAGQIVGAYTDANGKARGFLRSKGRFTDIVVPGATETAPFGNNNRGQIVGVYIDAAGDLGSFLRDSHGRFTTVKVRGALTTLAFDINDARQIVGSYADSPTTGHGYLLNTNGTITSFDAPNAAVTAGTGINNRGQITGQYVDSNGATHGLLRQPTGAIIPIDVPGSDNFTSSVHINDHGVIAGTYVRGGAGSTRQRDVTKLTPLLPARPVIGSPASAG
jgi:probable HAF family extracellular repeat protein